MLFFLMPTKFPYLIATMDAARILGENTALTGGIFLGIMGLCLIAHGSLLRENCLEIQPVHDTHRYLHLLRDRLCSLGFATSLVMVGFAVICIGLGEGILMPTILTWIAAITPRQFLGQGKRRVLGCPQHRPVRFHTCGSG